MLIHRRSLPQFVRLPQQFSKCLLSVLPMNTTQCPRPGLEPGPFAPGTSALTINSLCLPLAHQAGTHLRFLLKGAIRSIFTPALPPALNSSVPNYTLGRREALCETLMFRPRLELGVQTTAWTRAARFGDEWSNHEAITSWTLRRAVYYYLLCFFLILSFH